MTPTVAPTDVVSGLTAAAHAAPANSAPAPAPAPAQADYHRYYEADDLDLRKVAYLKRNILPLLNSLAPNSRILEVGPGRGALLSLLSSSGFKNIQAFEICTAFAESLASQGYTVASGPCAVEHLKSLPSQSLDAIVLIDVLEHFPLEDGLAFLKESRRVIAPQGRIILQTPNASGLFGMNTFVADPTHATPWNEIRLTAALRGSGFTTVNCLPMSLPLSPGNLLRESFRSVLFTAIRFLTRLCGATPVKVLTHNIVCQAQE